MKGSDPRRAAVAMAIVAVLVALVPGPATHAAGSGTIDAKASTAGHTAQAAQEGTPVPAAAASPQADARIALPLIFKTGGSQGSGTLKVSVFFDNGSGAQGERAGAGVIARADGREIGTTNSSGTLTATLPAGKHTVEAVLPSLATGQAEVVVPATGSVEARVILKGDGDVIEASDLVLDELVNGALSYEPATVTLRFRKNGQTVPVKNIEEVELSAVDPEFEPVDLTSQFEISPAGTIVARDAADLGVALATIVSDARLTVSATDNRGLSYGGTVTFAPGLFSVSGQLAAPPSQPSLTVGGRSLHVTYSTGGEQTVTTDSSGKFQLSQVPGGLLTVTGSASVSGQTYTVAAEVPIDGDTQFLVRMLGLADVRNGVAPWEITTVAAPTRPGPGAGEEAMRRAAGGRRPAAPTVPDSPAATAQVTVSGSGENVPVSDSATLDVAKGTKKVTLTYEVVTEEYPEWVLQQSRYNDTWSIRVLSPSGGQLASIGRAVNSQLYAPPTWNGAGSTGEIQQVIDVTTLAANADIQLTLSATTANIGDDLLATTVNAVLGAEAKITIDKLSHDTVVPTNGNSDRYSIPRPGEMNTNRRRFDVAYTKPDGVTITNVKAELLSSTGGVLQTIVDAAPGSPGVQTINDSTLRVEVTFNQTASQVASTPPPTDQIRYRFTLKGRNQKGEEIQSDPKESAAFYGLWRMPDGLPRYGQRDAGGDNWAAEPTYTWLSNNQNLVTRIDDISGEHGRDIGHQTHAEGKDIDMFHVYTFPNGGVSGTQNYLRLQENVRAALNGDAAALGRVDAWAGATRTRFDSLIDDADVQRIYYAIGSAAQNPGQPELAAGWARALLEDGTYTNPAGLTINLASGAWANAGDAKMRYNAVHNSHFHVALR